MFCFLRVFKKLHADTRRGIQRQTLNISITFHMYDSIEFVHSSLLLCLILTVKKLRKPAAEQLFLFITLLMYCSSLNTRGNTRPLPHTSMLSSAFSTFFANVCRIMPILSVDKVKNEINHTAGDILCNFQQTNTPQQNGGWKRRQREEQEL